MTGGHVVCASADLVERGKAVAFDVLEYGRPVSAFAVRYEGRVVAYLNRCAHVPSEMDWVSGEFFDVTRQWLICATHGALYEPTSGVCVRGPCVRGRLVPVRVEERQGEVCWYPEGPIQPVG